MSRIPTGTAIALGLLAVLAVTGQVRAAGEVATQIAIRPLDPVTIGDGDVIVDLRVAGGPALAVEPVELSIDGAYYRRTRTDADGVVVFGLPEDLSVGQHRLTAIYPGSTDAYLSSSTAAVVEVVPYEFTIETVPSLPGMAFTLDGERFVAGEDGVARISVGTTGDHQLAVLPEEYDVGGAKVDFSRWLPDSYGTEITINTPHVGPMQAGFDLFLPVSQVFLDPAGGTVEPGRVTSFTLRSSLGFVLNYPDGRERLYKASRVVRRSGGLESVDVRYNVTEVEVDGSNVVNAGQQRFYATPNATWRISLLLYSARVQPRDALFGFSAGTAVEVTYPNGTIEIVQAQPNDEVIIPWLARGIYRMTVADAPGWAPAMPVALSRDQDVELRVVSYLDMAIAMSVFVGIMFGLLHRGRPHLIPGTMRAAGRGVSSLAVPLRGAVRAAAPAADAAMGSSAAPGGGATEPQVSARQSDAVVPIGPILASIASPDMTSELPLPITMSQRREPGSGQVSEALLHMAPGLLAPNLESVQRVGSSPPESATISKPMIRAGQRQRPALAARAGIPNALADLKVAAATPKRRRAARTAAAGAGEKPSVALADDVAVPTEPPASRGRRAASKATTATKPKAAAKPKATTATKPKPKAAVKPKAAAKPKPTTATKPKAAAKPRAAAKPKAAGAAKTTGVNTKAGARPSAGRAAEAQAAGSRSSRSRESRAVQVRKAGRATATTPRAPRAAAATAPKRAAAVPRVVRQAQLSELGIRDPGQPTSGAALRQAPPDVALPMQSCRSCGLELWVGARFCRRCGQPSDESQQVDAPVVAANGRSPRVAKLVKPVDDAVAANAGRARVARGRKRGSA